MKRILVTGATGFIGGRTVEQLVSMDYTEIRAAGRNEQKGKELKNAHFYGGEINNDEYLEKITSGIDIVIHCAGLAGTWGNYESYYSANVLATKNLLDFCKKNNVQKFINISSPSIYFNYHDQFNLSENDIPKRFSNYYAQTKFEAEKLVNEAHCDKLQTVSLRPRFVIGRGDNQILPRLIRLQKAKMLVQIGNGENKVDITTVANVVDAILLCMNAKQEAMGEVYNINNGESVYFWEFVDTVINKMGLSAKRKKLPYSLIFPLAKVNEWRCRLKKQIEEPKLLPIAVAALAKSMTMNIDKAKAKLNYQPKQSLQEGVDEFILWWQNKP